MLAEIITIGDEILIGQIVDTNSAFIAQELNKVGVQVYQITSVQDEKQHILDALQDAQQRVDIVLVTGGLGPTKDDITKDTFLTFFDDHLVKSDLVTANIKKIFKERSLHEPLPSNLLQAMVPSKATVLSNEHGTAPGMWLEKDNTVFVSMPGVPYEMKRIMADQVIPQIVRKFNRPYIYHKTLLTYGKGESEIQEIIKDWEAQLPSEIKLAYLPSLGRVRLRLSSKGINQELLEADVNAQMDALYRIVKDIAVGYEGDTTIQEQIAAALLERSHTLSLAESCTGGSIAQEITKIKGASQYFKGSIIPYATALKSEVLGVDPNIIVAHTVVSTEVAEAMAIQSNKLFHTDYALATTGIAGPTQGDGIDEVGTVCIAIAGPAGVMSEKFKFGRLRERVIAKATNKAFEMLLKEILKN